jgi:hypothetical protein
MEPQVELEEGWPAHRIPPGVAERTRHIRRITTVLALR